jgi:hypothetical protein
MAIAAGSLAAWLESQERIMRAWLSEAALDPNADEALLERLDRHCQWLAQERALLEAAG